MTVATWFERPRRIDQIPNWLVTGGAGFETAINAQGEVVGPFPANSLGDLPGVGVGVWEARTNKCINNNYNPINLANISKSGDAAATLTVVDDTIALTVAGLGSLCSSGKVYKLDNSNGVATAYALVSGPTGNTNVHTWSFYARVSGAGANPLGRFSVNGAVPVTFTPAGYTRVLGTGTPAAASTLQIDVPPGRVVYFILNQLEEGSFATPVIPIVGAAATRTAKNISFPQPPDIKQGTVFVEVLWDSRGSDIFLEGGSVTGLSFSSVPDGAYPRLIFRSTANRLDFHGAGAFPGTPAVTKGSIVKMAMSWDATSVLAAVKGYAGQSVVTAPLGEFTGAPIYIGSRSGSAPYANTTIRKVSWLPYKMTQVELNALTV